MGRTNGWTVCLVLGLAWIVGMTGCAGHTASTAVSQESQPNGLALPELTVEEEIKDEPVMSSSVPPGMEDPTEIAATEPVIEPILQPPMGIDAPPPPAIEGTEILPFPLEEGPTNVFLLDIPFNFDQHALRDDALAFVEVNATRMKEEGVGRIVLEGRGDEVGTMEYNLVLGERRGQEVKRYLRNLGLDASKLQVVSYGKERPICFDHNTDCWQMNRSVRFVAE